jgi:hypothetical protein
MDFYFQYRITYDNGQFYDRPHVMTVDITKDEYKRIVLGVMAGKQINEIEDITEPLEKMTAIVHDIDRWTNMNGSQRNKPLKKARNISDLEFFLIMSDYKRFKKMDNLAELFDRPEDHMTIYRNDGSSVLISYEFGQVKVIDSRNSTTSITSEVDYFLSIVTRNG